MGFLGFGRKKEDKVLSDAKFKSMLVGLKDYVHKNYRDPNVIYDISQLDECQVRTYSDSDDKLSHNCSLAGDVLDLGPYEEEKTSSTGFCTECGSLIKNGAVFCSRCGRRVSSQNKPWESSSVDRPSVPPLPPTLPPGALVPGASAPRASMPSAKPKASAKMAQAADDSMIEMSSRIVLGKSLEGTVGMALSFPEYLQRLINRKGMKNSDVYKAANIQKQYFSKIMNGQANPSKEKIFAICFGLQLSLDEAKDLLNMAGYAFTNCSRQDLAVQYFLGIKEYNIIKIEIALDELGIPLLVS